MSRKRMHLHPLFTLSCLSWIYGFTDIRPSAKTTHFSYLQLYECLCFGIHLFFSCRHVSIRVAVIKGIFWIINANALCLMKFYSNITWMPCNFTTRRLSWVLLIETCSLSITRRISPRRLLTPITGGTDHICVLLVQTCGRVRTVNNVTSLAIKHSINLHERINGSPIILNLALYMARSILLQTAKEWTSNLARFGEQWAVIKIVIQPKVAYAIQ